MTMVASRIWVIAQQEDKQVSLGDRCGRSSPQTSHLSPGCRGCGEGKVPYLTQADRVATKITLSVSNNVCFLSSMSVSLCMALLPEAETRICDSDWPGSPGLPCLLPFKPFLLKIQLAELSWALIPTLRKTKGLLNPLPSCSEWLIRPAPLNHWCWVKGWPLSCLSCGKRWLWARGHCTDGIGRGPGMSVKKGSVQGEWGCSVVTGTGPTLGPQADDSVVTRQRPPSYQCLKILHIYFALRHKNFKTIILWAIKQIGSFAH